MFHCYVPWSMGMKLQLLEICDSKKQENCRGIAYVELRVKNEYKRFVVSVIEAKKFVLYPSDCYVKKSHQVYEELFGKKMIGISKTVVK